MEPEAAPDNDTTLESRIVALEETLTQHMSLIAEQAEALETVTAAVRKREKTIAALVDHVAEQHAKRKRARVKVKRLAEKFDLLSDGTEDLAKVVTGLIEQLAEVTSLVTGENTP